MTKEQNPAVPYTVEEIVREAKSAVDAGAAIVHLHVREDDGTPTQSKARFKECMDAIYKACPDVIIIPSTGGAVGMTAGRAFAAYRTISRDGDPRLRNMQFRRRCIREYHAYNEGRSEKRMLENNIKPEYECFEMGTSRYHSDNG